jgi:ABC-type enterobactin transport system permease subunit
MAGLIGFTIAGLAATAVALPVNWIPLLAPAIVAAVLIVAAWPLLADDRTGTIPAPTADEATAG